MTTDGADHPAWPLTDAGIWLDTRMAALTSPRPALFLDRDGVVVRDTGFLSDPASVALIPGIASLIKRANDVQIPVLVVTNQSGIDRGLLSWQDFDAVEARIAALLDAEGAITNATAACPFHPDYTSDYGENQARWRKPEPGMIEVFAEILNINLSKSCLIGDRLRDIEAARQASLAGGFLLSEPSAPDVEKFRRSLEAVPFEFDCGSSLAEADSWLGRSVLFSVS